MTAVEWLEIEIVKLETKYGIPGEIYQLCEQAKEMEKNNYICSKCKCSLDGKDMQQMQNKENT